MGVSRAVRCLSLSMAPSPLLSRTLAPLPRGYRERCSVPLLSGPLAPLPRGYRRRCAVDRGKGKSHEGTGKRRRGYRERTSHGGHHKFRGAPQRPLRVGVPLPGHPPGAQKPYPWGAARELLCQCVSIFRTTKKQVKHLRWPTARRRLTPCARAVLSQGLQTKGPFYLPCGTWQLSISVHTFSV